ncbi:MAG: hypothetical protein NXI25_26910 [bacterium]|nr:hypothetical protein [bacterium]
MSNKYQNGKIYKITDVGYNQCYFGSTCESLSQRMARHRRRYKAYQDNKDYCASTSLLFDEYGVENCKIELVENYPCNSKAELAKREGFYIQHNDCLNKRVAGRTQKEYQEQNADRVKETQKKWYVNHKEQVLQKQSQMVNCCCGAIFRTSGKAEHERTKKHQRFLNQNI